MRRAFALMLLACSSPRTGQEPAAPVSAASRPRIVAHRGASADAPENTLAAFRLAWELGVESCELDVRLSRDGVPVVIHDESTKRVAGVDLLVAEQTLDELRALDAGVWRGKRFAGERIPTLAEALDTLPASATMFVEIKTAAATAPAIARAIRAADPRTRGGRLALQGFDPDSLAALARELDHPPTFWTVDPPVEDELMKPYPMSVIDTAVSRGVTGLALDHRAVTEDFLAEARRQKLEIDVWTINDPAVIQTWLKRDVRWIETDRPELVEMAR